MTKVANILEFIKEDVNTEESMILVFFHKMLKINFKLILLLGIPFIIYLAMATKSLG